MQDIQTGSMVPLDRDTQEAKDAATPDRKRRGIMLTVGDLVTIENEICNTGVFCVRSFGKRFVMLEGMPGTTITEAILKED